MKKILFLLAAGAALAYFLDPESGAKRREDAKAKVNSFGSAS